MLQDEHSIEHYSIESGHTIHMVARPLNATPVGTPSSQDVREGNTASDGDPWGSSVRNQEDPAAPAVNPLQGLTGLRGISDLLFGGGRTADPPGPPRNAHSIEHIRQGILTLHSLRESMHESDIGPQAIAGVSESASRVFYTGQWVDVKDTVNQWLEATIMQVDNVGRRVFIHYNGW